MKYNILILLGAMFWVVVLHYAMSIFEAPPWVQAIGTLHVLLLGSAVGVTLDIRAPLQEKK
jgi:hypothetical protein